MQPNPFPGMNPYLEDLRLWAGFHSLFISALAGAINQKVPEGYVASVEARVYIERSEVARFFVPDITLTQSPAVSSPGRTAVLLADPPYEVAVEPFEIREPYIQVLALREGKEQLVAVIEVLSPTNKWRNAEGRSLYLQKQSALLQSKVHLLEIDLLHWGEHTVAVPLGWVPVPEWDYLVCLHRGGWAGHRFQVWAVRLWERLPKVWVPLAEGDADIVVDLQAVLERVFEEGAYSRRLDYRKNLAVELPDSSRRWLESFLAERLSHNQNRTE